MIDVTLLFNKSNPFGISKDVEGIRKALGGGAYSLRESDPLEPPVKTGVAIHLEIPVYSWMPWAARNILVVNPEWFEAAWRPYMSRFDLVIYKDPQAREEAIAAGIVTAEQALLVPWGLDEPAEANSSATKKAPTGNANTGFVWFLGGSRNKRAAVAPLVALWKETYPPLRIYAVEPLPLKDASGTELVLPSNVRVEVKDLDAATRQALSRFFRGHVACSKAEGFGYTAAEAEWAGAFTILNDLPVYRAAYAGEPGVHILPSLEGEAASAALDVAITAFEATDFTALAKQRKLRAMERWDDFKAAMRAAVDAQATQLTAAKQPKHLPPILEPADCPPISIITLLYNRRKFFDLACHNIMITDYPKSKIEWIIVEDSDDPMEDASDRVAAVAAVADPVKIVYVPLKKKRTVGAKRNAGIQKATSDIIVMMDDDDHYPETSIRRRVAWLTAHPWGVQAVTATTIACYDLVHGVSAVNSPPFTLPLSQRVSEATLAFRRSFWEARPFPADIQVGEGEGFLAGREQDVLEIPPQQAIVAFSHGKNASSRRLPSGEGLKPGCFWGFPAPFLKFIHELAGVKVVAEEEESSSRQKGKKK